MDWLNELVHKAISFSIQKFIEDAINEYMGALVSLREVGLDLLSTSYFTNAILYLQGIAALTLVVKVAFEAKAVHILRLNGDPEADPYGLLKGTATSAVLIATIPWMLRQVWMFSLSIQRDIANIEGTDLASNQDVLLHFLLNIATMSVVLAAGAVVALVIFLLVSFQSLIHAVDLTINGIIGIWMALGKTNEQSNTVSIWWKDLLGTALIPALQLLVLKGAFVLWADITSMSDGARVMMFIILMYCAYRIPQRVQMYVGYSSTGVGRTTVSLTQTLFTRMMMRR